MSLVASWQLSPELASVLNGRPMAARPAVETRLCAGSIPGDASELVSVEDRDASARRESDGAETFEVSQSPRGHLTDCPDLRRQLMTGGKYGKGARLSQPKKARGEARHDVPKRQISGERTQLPDPPGQDAAEGKADLGIPHHDSAHRVPRNKLDDGWFHCLGVGGCGRAIERGIVAERLAGDDVVQVLFPAIGGAPEDPDGPGRGEVEALRGLSLGIDQRALLVVSRRRCPAAHGGMQ